MYHGKYIPRTCSLRFIVYTAITHKYDDCQNHIFQIYKSVCNPVRNLHRFLFHLFADAQRVDACLKNAHYYFSEAKRFFNDPEIAFIKSRKKIKSDQLTYILEKYLDVIQNCRTAKQCGLEIYKIKNEFRTGTIQEKYQLRKDQITPIFDDRIPEKFKVDAVDNVGMLYPVEQERKKKTIELTK